jgi:hypothetical protein
VLPGQKIIFGKLRSKILMVATVIGICSAELSPEGDLTYSHAPIDAERLYDGHFQRPLTHRTAVSKICGNVYEQAKTPGR